LRDRAATALTSLGPLNAALFRQSSSFGAATLPAARREDALCFFVDLFVSFLPAASSRACATQLSRWKRPDDAR